MMRLHALFPVLLVGLGLSLSLASCDPDFLLQPDGDDQDTSATQACTGIGVTEETPVIANTIELVKGDERGNHGTYEDPSAPGIALPVYRGADFTYNGRPGSYTIPEIPIPRSSDNPPQYWNWTIPWGNVYYPQGKEDRPENLRIEIRNLRSYYFNQARREWVQIDATTNGITGAYYRNDFAGDVNNQADIVTHDEQASISVPVPPIDSVFHFFRGGSSSRQPVDDPANCVGFYSSCEARLVRADCADDRDNRDDAEIYLGMGLDVWATEDVSGNDPAFEYHQDAMLSRHRRLDANWQTYNGITFINNDTINLDAYPPPLN